MNHKKTLAVVSTSALAAGMAQGSVVYSGPLNLQQNFSSSLPYRQGVSMGVSGTNDFAFGYEAGDNKPYVDARTYVGNPSPPDVGGNSGLVTLLANANTGLPVTPGGTTIDAAYAGSLTAFPAGLSVLFRGWQWEPKHWVLAHQRGDRRVCRD